MIQLQERKKVTIGVGADNEWSETKASSSSDKAAKKPTSGSGIAKKKMEPKSKATNEDLLIDFGASGGGKGSEKKTSEDSWANWENDAWESLSKKRLVDDRKRENYELEKKL